MTPPIEVVRHPRARRASLRVDPTDGRVRLVLPLRAPLKPMLAWAAEKHDWIAAQRRAMPPPLPFAPGLVLPVDDRDLILAWDADAPRQPRPHQDTLYCGGPIEGLAMRVRRWLGAEALRLLAADTAFYAARAGVTVPRVAIGDPRSRWGSCAADGVIRYSWRLALSPARVRRATAAHEVAHRIHMDHSPAFHAVVADLYDGDATAARAWLRANGAWLHSFGRTG